MKTIVARKQKWIQDSKGYFLIRLDRERNNIEVGWCEKLNAVKYKFVGKHPIDLYKKITRMNLMSRMDHAAYLGEELEKAYIALKTGKRYVQDMELEF